MTGLAKIVFVALVVVLVSISFVGQLFSRASRPPLLSPLEMSPPVAFPRETASPYAAR